MRARTALIALSLCPLGWGEALDVVDDAEWLSSLLGIEADESLFFPEEESEYDLLDTEKESLRPSDFERASPWVVESQYTIGTGWRENVLLSEDAPLSSVYGQVAVDFFATRRPEGTGPQFTAVGYGEYRYYTDVPGMDSESLALGSLSLDWVAFEDWKLGLFGETLFSEQAFDASLLDFESEAATVSVFQPEIGARLATAKRGSTSFSLAGRTGRVFYDEEGQDRSVARLSLEGEHGLGKFGFVSGGLGVYQENYDDKEERSVTEGALGETLAIDGVNAQITWGKRLDGWILNGLRISLHYDYEDDALGDYYERSMINLKQSVDFSWGEWDGRFTLRYIERRYLNRPIERFAEEKRQDQGWGWGVQLRHPTWNRRLDWEIRLDGLEKESNAAGFSYDTFGAFFGLSWKGLGQN